MCAGECEERRREKERVEIPKVEVKITEFRNSASVQNLRCLTTFEILHFYSPSFISRLLNRFRFFTLNVRKMSENIEIAKINHEYFSFENFSTSYR